MPTASTSQIMNNNESIEPYTSNIYVRLTNAGEYIVVNKHLVEDLQNLNLWNKDIYNEILYYSGSIQKMDLPQKIKDKYKTAYEIKQSKIIKQSIDRGQYIDQTQSLNLFIDTPDFTKLNSCHFYGWKNGLKTGLYYLRSKPAVDPMKFNLDPEFINKIENKQKNAYCEYRKNGDDVCIMCSS
jgi:ribonucleoside-diphosphate reductase alpha chain